MGPKVWLINNQGLPKPPWAQLQLPALRMLRAEYHGTSPVKNADFFDKEPMFFSHQNSELSTLQGMISISWLMTRKDLQTMQLSSNALHLKAQGHRPLDPVLHLRHRTSAETAWIHNGSPCIRLKMQKFYESWSIYNNCQWFETAKVDSESKRERGRMSLNCLGEGMGTSFP